ncbi:MAG TPA: BTAD domain-containing putative transcriptional regulator [Actinomycetota bacterium]|nr:BTAD domain-containing putative transcriptional regulator [Actinomycetota bacterium]
MVAETKAAEVPPGQVRLGLLGGFRLSVQGREVVLPMNAQRLVTFLALQERPLLRTFVSGSLWGDSTDGRAAGSLRSTLWRLTSPGPSLVALTTDHIVLSPAVEVDYREGEALARRVLDPDQPLEGIVEASELVLSADLLPDWTEDWVLLERESYHQLRLRALEALCRRLTEEKRFGQAVQAGMAAVAGEPLRESARHALIQAHLAEENVAAAIREYDSFRQLLHAELELEPSESIQGLVAHLIDTSG